MINLFVNYYKDKDPRRAREIDECLSRNMANPLIDKIFLVVEDDSVGFEEIDTFGKIERVVSKGRPSFRFLFNLANSIINGEEISIIANSDIYFEEYDVSLISYYLTPDKCFALSRWNREANGAATLFNREDSQDSWSFKGRIKDIRNCDFTMGRLGCDNAIAQRIQAAGYIVDNPSYHIKSIHVHQSGVRNYDIRDRAQVVEQPYKNIKPGHLHLRHGDNWVTSIAHLDAAGLQSQFEEEAIINHIFENIGKTNKFFVDLGAGSYGDSKMSNTRNLIQTGWNGYGVDINNKGEPWIIERFITPQNIVQILSEQHTPQDFDFLNIDIDSSDFWVLAKLLGKYHPRCICTEFNGTLDPYISVVLKYEENYTWDETNKYGYSFLAGKKLLAKYDYRVIYNMRDQNLFAVKKELVHGLIFNVTASQALYHPESRNAIWELY